MAAIFIGINRGVSQEPALVLEGATTNSVDVEVQISSTAVGAGITRKDVLLALCAIHQYLLDGTINNTALGL